MARMENSFFLKSASFLSFLGDDVPGLRRFARLSMRTSFRPQFRSNLLPDFNGGFIDAGSMINEHTKINASDFIHNLDSIQESGRFQEFFSKDGPGPAPFVMAPAVCYRSFSNKDRPN